MNIKSVISLLFVSGLFAALFLQCSTGISGSSVSGKIDNARNLQLYFDKQNPKTQVLATTTVESNDKFSIALPEGFEESIYRVRLGKKNIAFPLKGDESKIELSGDLNTMDKYQIEIGGSPLASEYAKLVKEWRAGSLKPDVIEAKMLALPTALASMAAAKTMIGNNRNFVGMHDKVLSRMEKEMPSSDFTSDYKAFVNGIKNPPARPEKRKPKPANTTAMKIGQQAPEINLPSPDGKNYSLADLKGKVVLLDFWASWCKPCRRENPHVVEIYKKYKSKGFTVFSVSLDRTPDRWKKAILQDKLTWPFHVSDLKQWSSQPAAEYGVKSIPKTFMIDKEGKIAAVGLRGAASIENELKKLL